MATLSTSFHGFEEAEVREFELKAITENALAKTVGSSRREIDRTSRNKAQGARRFWRAVADARVRWGSEESCLLFRRHFPARPPGVLGEIERDFDVRERFSTARVDTRRSRTAGMVREGAVRHKMSYDAVAMSGIRVAGLTKTYRGGAVRALDSVSLDVRAGEAFGIIGPNGAGKTTLMGCLLGMLRPDSGRIEIDGRAPDALAVRRVVGYLPERLVLDRWMTGTRFLAYHHALAELDPARRSEDVRTSFERVGLEPAAASMTIRKYSRGMLQRLGLAQALLGSPRYLFLDEPISGVDPAGVILFRRLLSEVRARGATLIVNSHQLAEVERICDRVAFVKAGHIESIETSRAADTLAHVLLVRWTASTGPEITSAERLAAVAQSVEAVLHDTQTHGARFGVRDDDGTARQLDALRAAGVRITEARPEGSRLERLFAERPEREEA